ncbi:Lysine histidine transporter 1 [Chlorella sorokiniana]|uniref:Lysine histidine transporter 1 n=1 Tax=Chlorella sorokiniana TaxID=3076 RepID=A0A2P6TPB8_CHLSO|nr:Lysine histidine transporter 1 [Chlorella sorokiniana]|eukprot:PRW51175.1 Lysine histidine transporter 1 [Chlorella sorokiniana]
MSIADLKFSDDVEQPVATYETQRLTDGAVGSSGRAAFELETAEHKPRASWHHAAFHTVTAVVGAGVLGLPHAFSFLGWPAGLLLLSLLCAASLYTSYLLAALHELPNGTRLNTYKEMGEALLGPRRGKLLIATVQYTLCVGLCITYSVTAGQSLKGVASEECSGVDCQQGISAWIVLFGGLQLLLSQAPDFHSLWWISLLGALMSCGYCSIAIVMSSLHAAKHGPATQWRHEGISQADRVFSVFNALGSVAFTFGGQAVLPEIQATLARPSREQSTAPTMMKGIWISYVVVIIAYYGTAICGYAAFGATVSSDVLLNIKEPAGVMAAANLFVVLHVAAAWQVFAMPIFDAAETGIRRRLASPPRPLTLRLLFRSAYVAAVTFVACLLPFFGELMGLISSIGLMPVTFILPPVMWLRARSPGGAERALCLLIIAACSIIAALSLVGSARNIAMLASQFGLFSGGERR